MTARADCALLIRAAQESLLLAARDALAANRAASAGDLRIAERLLIEIDARAAEAKALLDAVGAPRVVPVQTAAGVEWVEEGAPVFEIQAETSRAIGALAMAA